MRLKKTLATKFEVKELRQMRHFLGMKVARSKKGISVFQGKYFLDIRTCLCVNLVILQLKLKKRSKELGDLVDKDRHQKLVRKLIYLSHTRLLAVSMVIQHMHSSNEAYFEVIYKILRYLKGSPSISLFFKKSENNGVDVFIDANYAGSIENRRSAIGYCILIFENLITWRSKKKNVVAISSVGAKFKAIA